MGKFLKDLTGNKYGRLTVVSFEGNTKHRLSTWRCSCECGKEVVVIGGNLKTGTTTSCGCYSLEGSLERFTTHGMTNTAEFKCWQEVMKRVQGKKTKNALSYSQRGIDAHQDFKDDFLAFYNEIGPRPEPVDGKLWSVGRIDNDLGYTYGNIRWELPVQQARNKTRYANNTTGIAGVSCMETVRKDSTIRKVYLASYTGLDGRQHSKTFNVDKLGEEGSLAQAAAWRKEAIQELNRQGAGYSEKHGSEK